MVPLIRQYCPAERMHVSWLVLIQHDTTLGERVRFIARINPPYILYDRQYQSMAPCIFISSQNLLLLADPVFKLHKLKDIVNSNGL